MAAGLGMLLGLVGFCLTENSIKLTPYNYMNFIFFVVGVICLSGAGYLVMAQPF